MSLPSGPLKGVRVIEFASMGPAPFCAMLLSDMGAETIRIDRPDVAQSWQHEIVNRGRRSLALDLKRTEAKEVCLKLVEKADVLIEGFRPGVMERLGLGPVACMQRNPTLIYGRITGWGQTGPLASTAGHDINYIALAGALHGIGRAGHSPVPPLSLLGDYGGGALYLALGICAALYETRQSGVGQVIDAAMTDGVASLMTAFFGALHTGHFNEQRGSNLVDGAAPFYNTYETNDGQYIAVGAIEPKFYRLLLERIGLADDPLFADQMDRSRWPAMSERMLGVFRTRTHDAWRRELEGTEPLCSRRPKLQPIHTINCEIQ